MTCPTDGARPDAATLPPDPIAETESGPERSVLRATRPSRFGLSEDHFRCWMEIGLVIMVVVLPTCWVVVAEKMLWIVPPHDDTYISRLVRGVIQNLRDIFLITFIIWCGREQWVRFGVVRVRWLRDLVAGATVFLANCAAAGLIRAVAASLSGGPMPTFHIRLAPTISFSTPALMGYTAMVLALTVVSALAQESVYRGFLIPKLEQVSGSCPKAVFLSALIFASMHLRSGLSGFTMIFAAGLIYGIAFCRLRRLWPVIVAHVLWNFFGAVG